MQAGKENIIMILGIDLGTSNSLAAVYKDGEVVLVKSSTGNYSIPSVVSVDDDGVFYTGDVAKERLTTHPKQTASLFKRSIGTNKLFSLGDKELRAEELSAIVLKGIKEDAESFLGEEITDAIISVPAFFSNPQRKAVMRAGELAGFCVKKIVNEPTAAAMAYNMLEQENSKENLSEENSDSERIIMVLDLGGGTFDISIMEATKDVMEVIAVCGDNELGGRDFTKRLMDMFLNNFNIGEELSAEDYERLWKCTEKAKLLLSKDGEADINCTIQNQQYEYHVTEDEYEKECFDLIEKIRKLMVQAVAESEYESHDIEDIILVGGGTKLSIVRKAIEKMTDKELSYKINPDEAVVYGAALQGALYDKSEKIPDIVMTDICPYYIGKTMRNIDDYDFKQTFEVVIPKNHIVPARISKKSSHWPNTYTQRIWQAEDEYGTNINKICELEFILPETKEDKTELMESLILDNNGIIHYEIYIPSVDKTYSTTVLNEGSELDMEQAKTRLEELCYLNIDGRENDINSLVMARAENMYTECLGKEREEISRLIGVFEEALKRNKKKPIESARENLTKYLDWCEVM